MSTNRFDNFGELYRAAFAENNPEIKQSLLADVQSTLNQWAECDHNTTVRPPTGPKPSQKDCSSFYRVA